MVQDVFARTFGVLVLFPFCPFVSNIVLSEHFLLIAAVACLIIYTEAYTGRYKDVWSSVEEDHTEVPADDIPRDIHRINLYHNKISGLRASDFSGLRDCDHIDLSYNLISVIQPGALQGKFGCSFTLTGSMHIIIISLSI